MSPRLMTHWIRAAVGLLSLSVCLVAASAELRGEDNGPLATAVKPFVDREELAGAVMLVADREKVLDVETAGWADIDKKKPMQANSMFWIASQSKPVTAAAVMILVDEGKVSLDDPVEKFLPEFKGLMWVAEKDDQHKLLKAPRHPITVRNILSHTSGMPFRSAIEQPALDLWPLSLRVRSYAMTPLDFDPDTKYQYSNAGINTGARIIEVVTGKSFEDFLDERLFRPLGMTDTTFWPNEEQNARVAKSYKPGPNNAGLKEIQIDQLTYPLTDRTKRFPMPAGGLFSTAGDIAKFYRMLLNGGELDGKRYLSEKAVHELTTKQTPPELKDNYGLGFGVGDHNFGHGGAYSTNTNANTKDGVITVWLVQHAGFPGEGGKSQGAFQKAAYDNFARK